MGWALIFYRQKYCDDTATLTLELLTIGLSSSQWFSVWAYFTLSSKLISLIKSNQWSLTDYPFSVSSNHRMQGVGDKDEQMSWEGFHSFWFLRLLIWQILIVVQLFWSHFLLMQLSASPSAGGQLSVSASWSHAKRDTHTHKHTLTCIPQRFSQ